ncbi:MAG: tetratricopeptide repeat protein [Methylophilaceae bacterium]
MSLLIKALEKAEQGKNTDGKATSVNEFSLEPITDTSSNNEAFLLEENVARTAATEQVHDTQRAAATMFAAKNKSNTTSRNFLIIVGVSVALLILVGMALYTYIGSLTQPDLVVAKAPVVPIEKPVSIEETASGVIEPSVIKESDTAAKNTINAGQDAAYSEERLKANTSSQSQPMAAKPAPRVFGEPVEFSKDTAVQITRNNAVTTVNPVLLSAYQSLMAGDDVTAQRNYRQVLQSDIRNVDALIGMAAIATHQGRNDDAKGWYGKVLEIEPRNAIAQTAILSLVSQTDPVASESRIKSLLTQQPQTAYLHAALGGLYAEQGKWAAAQQSYFEAHHLDSSNAEYAFNLAVSLDQLGKPALALQYYKRALELLPQTGGNLDRAQLESRISQLQTY